MKILGLETATYFGGVAFVGGGARDSRGPFAPRESSREILAAAQELLDKNGCAASDLDLVAVSTGPGLFTGVRVGLSIAKTLAWSKGESAKPALVTVPTLEAVASLAVVGGAAKEGDLIAAVTDARRGEVYAALFGVEEGGRVRPMCEDMVVRPERLAERLFDGVSEEDKLRNIWVVGDGVDRYGEAVLAGFGERAKVFNHADGNLAFCVADLGRERFEMGLTESVDRVQPHYVRRPDARLPVKVFEKDEGDR